MTRRHMGDLLTIGQVWERRRDGEQLRVKQVYRREHLALMVSVADGSRRLVRFTDLRRYWRNNSEAPDAP